MQLGAIPPSAAPRNLGGLEPPVRANTRAGGRPKVHRRVAQWQAFNRRGSGGVLKVEVDASNSWASTVKGAIVHLSRLNALMLEQVRSMVVGLERCTALQAMPGGAGVDITFSGLTVRNDYDVDLISEKLHRAFLEAGLKII